MSKKTKLINILVRCVFTCTTLCLTAQLLIIARGFLDRILWNRFFINFCVAYPVACMLGMTIPAAVFGMWICKKLSLKPGILCGIVMALAINLIYTAILSTVMTFLNTVILNGESVSAVLPGIVQNFIPMWIASTLVSMVVAKPIDKLTELLVGGAKKSGIEV